MITPGTILMEQGTERPKCFHLEDGPYPDAWMPLKHDLTAYELEQELASSGWAFRSGAREVRSMAIGFDRAKTVHRALRRLIAAVKAQHCNCLEVDEVATSVFLGVPYISITAHPRNIQKNGDRSNTVTEKRM